MSIKYKNAEGNIVDIPTGGAETPEWSGTQAEWEALDKTTLEDGTTVYITDDDSTSDAPDMVLSETSKNCVANKPVATAINEINNNLTSLGECDFLGSGNSKSTIALNNNINNYKNLYFVLYDAGVKTKGNILVPIKLIEDIKNKVSNDNRFANIIFYESTTIASCDLSLIDNSTIKTDSPNNTHTVAIYGIK